MIKINLSMFGYYFVILYYLNFVLFEVVVNKFWLYKIYSVLNIVFVWGLWY